VLAEAQRQGALTAAITNAPGSDLARVADHVIDLHAGEEKSVAATKSYTAELGAIALLSACLNGDAAQMDALMRAPDFMAETLALQDHVAAIAERYRYMTSCVTIGRGFNYATAFELALKLKEMTYTMVEPYSSADFLHGPVALIHSGFPVIVVAPSGVMLPELKVFMATARAADAELLAISDDADLLRAARSALPLPCGIPEWLSPIPAIIPGQLFAMHLAWSRDLDPDHPRGLKKVTETF
jgi:glucosamine--fructose-6-phosphate aminotransferase (isomerizing)